MGASASKIARLLQVNPNAVKEAIAASRATLELYAPQAAEYWIEAARNAAANGDHKPAQALMQAVDVVRPPAQSYDVNPGAKAVAAVRVELHGFNFAGLPTPAMTPNGVTTIDAAAVDTTAPSA